MDICRISKRSWTGFFPYIPRALALKMGILSSFPKAQMSHEKKQDDFNTPAPKALDLLLTRRSGSAKAMKDPGPSGKQLADILKAGARAPDHGKLFPWRFIIFEGEGRSPLSPPSGGRNGHS